MILLGVAGPTAQKHRGNEGYVRKKPCLAHILRTSWWPNHRETSRGDRIRICDLVLPKHLSICVRH